ncbi:UvrABC nucleotide excision repair complex, subunit UvrC [Malaciobacter marinus]|uniref:UvrABC system protein C n=1 Tax=Malaciobacter marinus TaxID=505249 RepID=A0A347TJD8_9BACT|nr:excinuclease ABC subunit UvrC [Malaciobacter marinus]AXX86716.1 UvrABC nucleotide excision repair complex, subunit UvrC [Malaciobacter marinus]PHO12929.1 excinuclease ABC subunit C [Malaciobacter marinus]PHO14158.1 excinuclease ABC subunit C [Malaciobacter marinus]
MNLEEKLKELPNSAGVYQYFNKDGHLLYIGKAKVLKNRVKSYFKFTPNLAPADKLSPRIYKMITEVKSLEWIIAPNEHDALILENSLIKQLKPKYNILLRDDKTYPYIVIDYKEDFPRLEITRKVLKDKNIKYFGPYSTGARDMLDSIYEIIPLVQKKSCIKGKEACLFHQIKKCYAPCVGKISKEEYSKIVDEALEYIYNKNKLIKKLNERMLQYSEEFRFEEAMKIRDRIKTIEKSQIHTGMDLASNDNLDLFAIKASKEKAVIVRMFFRDGKLASSNHDYLKINQKELDIDLNEAYKRAIINYYDNEIPLLPKEIVVADEITQEIEELQEFIKDRFEKNIPIIHPKRGKKTQIIKIAINNCNELLRLQNSNATTIYKQLQELLNLSYTPNRFECFDNSHMMGQATVGAMITWEEKFIKADYRHYNLEAKDEYAQMKETLIRRVQSFEKNPAPDVWVIDGGETLLKLAIDIRNSVGVNLDIIAIAKEKLDFKAHRAKGSAKDIIYFEENSNIKRVDLLPSDKRLQFIQRLRDEAHRFAISFHKKQKRKDDSKISLLQIKGIGEAKVKKLLLYFGEFEKIKNASFDELKIVLNEKDASLLINYFKTLDN